MSLNFETLTGFTYRGLAPLKFTPVPGVHHALHPIAAPGALLRVSFSIGEQEMIIMARSTVCAIGKRMVDVDEAIVMRDNARSRRLDYPDFRCPECGESVQPHCAGGGACAHFEHLSRNPNCRLSDPAR
jgi:hypothetical protein